MKTVFKLIVFFIIASSIYSCQKGDYVKIYKYPSGEIQNIEVFADPDFKVLKRSILIDRSGDTIEDLNYQNNEVISRIYFDTITRDRYYLEYKNSLLHGVARSVNYNGKTIVSHYLNDTLHGRELYTSENGDTTDVLWYIKGKLALAIDFNHISPGDTIRRIISVGHKSIVDTFRIADNNSATLIKEFYLRGKRSHLLGSISYKNSAIDESVSSYIDINVPSAAPRNDSLSISVESFYKQIDSFISMDIIIGLLNKELVIEKIYKTIEGDPGQSKLDFFLNGLLPGYNLITGIVIVHFESGDKTLPFFADVSVIDD